MSPLARVNAASRAMTQRIAFIGVVGMLVVGMLTTVDVVVLRWMFASPIPGSNEFLTTIFAVAIAAVLASGLAQRANLEIDMLHGALGARTAAWLRAGGSVLFLLLLIFLAWRVAIYAVQATERGQVTVILQWHTSPFLWAITALVALCVPVQLVVALTSVGEAMRQRADRDRRGDVAPSDRRVATKTIYLAIGALAADFVAYLLVESAQPTASSHAIAIAVIFLAILWIADSRFRARGGGPARLRPARHRDADGLATAPSMSLGSETAGLITNADLAVIPLFLMMGGFANASGLSSDIYRLAHALFGFQRGGLALATVGGCAGFGALTGSSLATVATMGSVALPEMRRARLFARALDRLHRRGRHARPARAAVDRDRRLRAVGRAVDRPALHRGLGAGGPDRRPLHARDLDDRAHQPGVGTRPRAVRCPRAVDGAQALDRRLRHVRRRDRRHLFAASSPRPRRPRSAPPSPSSSR